MNYQNFNEMRIVIEALLRLHKNDPQVEWDAQGNTESFYNIVMYIHKVWYVK